MPSPLWPLLFQSSVYCSERDNNSFLVLPLNTGLQLHQHLELKQTKYEMINNTGTWNLSSVQYCQARHSLDATLIIKESTCTKRLRSRPRQCISWNRCGDNTPLSIQPPTDVWSIPQMPRWLDMSKITSIYLQVLCRDFKWHLGLWGGQPFCFDWPIVWSMALPLLGLLYTSLL